MAKKMGTISRACSELGISRSSYYSWNKRYSQNDLPGLVDKTRTARHPAKTKPEIVEKVIDLSMEHPESGCATISRYLAHEKISVSPPTVQKVLNDNNLGKVSDRLFHLEKMHLVEGRIVTPVQMQMMIKNNPCLRELGRVGEYPGEILVQDTFPIFNIFPGTYVHVVIDTYSFYAFAYLWSGKDSYLAADLLHQVVLRFFRKHNLKISIIMTDSGYEFTRQGQVYKTLLHNNNIIHKVYSGKEKNWNGFILRYKDAFIENYKSLELNNMDSVASAEIIRVIQNSKLWGNTKMKGFPNYGLTPQNRIKLYLSERIASR